MSDEIDQLMERVREGDQQALMDLFVRYRERLKRMVRLRLDRRVQQRVDVSDVLQEAWLDVARRAPEYLQNQDMDLFLWMRWLTGERLLAIHRRHLGAQKRDVARDIAIHRGAIPHAASASLAAQLLGHLTNPGDAAIRAELQVQLQDVLNGMDEIDREVLVLRHFEELSNNETAAILGIQKAAASNRYKRALMRLRDLLVRIPGFLE